MNRHLKDGELRAALDGELEQARLQHLQSCSVCLERQKTIQRQAEAAAGHLSFLSESPRRRAPSVQQAQRHFYTRSILQKEIPIMKRILASTAVRVAVVAAVLLVVILSVPSVRAMADEVLNLFRVQQVTVVSIDATGLQQLTGDGTIGKQFSQLVSSSMTVTHEAGDPQPATNAADASQKAGFNVRLPKAATPSRLMVQDRAGFDFKIDRSRAQELMNEAGRQDLVLPESIDGALISVAIPASVRADFGTCPDPTQADAIGNGSRGRQYPDCMIMAQIPSPTVNAPAGVDVEQLARIGLEFGGMTPDQATAFTQSVDWTSTLVIPIPKNAATYQQVSVDGVTGTLIQRPADDAPEFVLVWVKNGVIYSIGGLGTNWQQALDMGNSLP